MLSRKKIKATAQSLEVNTILDPSKTSSRARLELIHLTASDPISHWIHYQDGSINGVFFSLLAKNPDGENNILSGNIKIQCINGQDETREYAICDMIKNTSDLATIFYFNSAHLGKCGIEANIQQNCCFRLYLEPNAGDDVWIEVIMNS